MREQAVKKLEDGKKTGRFDGKAGAMKTLVCQVLQNLCSDGEFAQAVVQGGSFEDCMKAVAKGVGNSISDLDAVSKAVQFYFPGAKVHYDIRLDLAGDAGKAPPPPPPAPEAPAAPAPKVISLADFW